MQQSYEPRYVRETRDKHPALGILLITYGVILCCFWALVLWASWREVLERPWTTGGVLTAVVFALVTVLLVCAGCVLLSSHADARLSVWAAGITGLALGAKAILACSWALDEGGLAFWALMGLVVVPSGIWALVLAGTAAWLTGEPSDGLAADASSGHESGPATQPSPSRRARVWAVLALGCVVQLAGIALVWIANRPSPVTATELLAAYRDDAQRAEANYKDKWLEVTGKIARRYTVSTMAPWSGSVSVTIEADDKDVPGAVTVWVSESFPVELRAPGATYEDFRSLTEGQKVTIRGKCSGMTESGVRIESPRIIK
jgi:hypothetical protein